MQSESTKDIKQAFSVYLQESALRYLTVKLILAVLIIGYFAYADMIILKSPGNFYSRLLSLGVAVPLLIFHILTKHNYSALKAKLINVLIIALMLMMYSICVVHVNEDTLSEAVTATTVVIFIVSLEIKAGTRNAALIYFVPTILLFLISVLFYDLSGNRHLILSNIYAFVIFGFVLNRIQNSLRFKAFQSNYLLNKEKQKTEKHYQDALKLNAELSKTHQEIVKQAAEIDQANQQLKKLNLFKEEMTGMIVHDLKNPLNSIIGLAESETVKQAGKQMLGMVMNMLDVQKYENTEIVLDTSKNAVDEIADSAVSQVDVLLKQKSILLKNQIRNYIVSVEWELIERVFVNILTNAIKYTPNNGIISLGSDLVQNNEGPDFVKITITDTGQGIPPDKLDTVFQKFEQVVAKKSGIARSTGIGLTYCKLIVEAHGGKIGVESEVGAGTTIWFTLPAVSQGQQEIRPEFDPTKKFQVELSELEKQQLRPFLHKIRRLSIYEYSSMETILQDLVFAKTDNLSQWKEAMNNALLTSNQEQFETLITMISDTK